MMQNEVYLTRVMSFVKKGAYIEVVIVDGDFALFRKGVQAFQ